MGWNFRKSFKIGPARVNLSKSGVGYSIGAGGVRYTKRAGSKKRGAKTGCFASFVKTMFYLSILAVVIYLVTTHWKWIAALIAVALIAAVCYQVCVHKKIHPGTKNDSEHKNNDPES